MFATLPFFRPSISAIYVYFNSGDVDIVVIVAVRMHSHPIPKCRIV